MYLSLSEDEERECMAPEGCCTETCCEAGTVLEVLEIEECRSTCVLSAECADDIPTGISCRNGVREWQSSTPMSHTSTGRHAQHQNTI